MSKNLKKIISILSLVYFLSVALVWSGIALAGGIDITKLLMSWVFFVSAGIIVLLAKMSSPYITFFTLFRKKRRVHNEI